MKLVRQDAGAIGSMYGCEKVLESLQKHGKARHLSCNLTCTGALLSTDLGPLMSTEKQFTRTQWCNKDGQLDAPPLASKNCNIRIAVYSAVDALVNGDMERLGLGLYVSSVWLAYAWAVRGENAKQRSKLERIILDSPFEFQFCGSQHWRMDTIQFSMNARK